MVVALLTVFGGGVTLRVGDYGSIRVKILWLGEGIFDLVFLGALVSGFVNSLPVSNVRRKV
jgi:hypothetical protein